MRSAKSLCFAGDAPRESQGVSAVYRTEFTRRMKPRFLPLHQPLDSRAAAIKWKRSRVLTVLAPQQCQAGAAARAVRRIPPDPNLQGDGGARPESDRTNRLPLLAAIRAATTNSTGNLHKLATLSIYLSGVAVTDQCSPSGSRIVRSQTVGTVVGLGTHTITVTAVYAAGNAGPFVHAPLSDRTAPLTATRGSRHSTPSRGSNGGAEFFTATTAPNPASTAAGHGGGKRRA